MDKLLILTLLNIPGVSRKTVSKLISNDIEFSLHTNDIFNLFDKAREKEKRIVLPSLLEIELAKNKAEELLLKSYQQNIECMTIYDKDFPRSLKSIDDSPHILFFKGNKKCLINEKSIALIGTRNPSQHSEKIAYRFGTIFAEYGFTVISGLAKGCDEFGHKGSLSVNGKNIAVLPGGLDKIYPSSNKELANSILENDGCLISEYPIGTRPYKSSFIERDRLQSGLSKGVIVVETGIKSGTMHTVKFTLNQNRLLACYDRQGEINDDAYAGNKILIEEGKATSLSSREDIEEFIRKVSSYQIESENFSKKTSQLSIFDGKFSN